MDGTHLARGVDLGRVPLGLVLEVDLVAHEVGLGFVQGDFRLVLRSVRSRRDGWVRAYPLREGADLSNGS